LRFLRLNKFRIRSLTSSFQLPVKPLFCDALTL
jgi:hypothetical protein